MRKFKLHWKNGETENVEGWSLEHACMRTGLMRGALAALDYWEEIDGVRVGHTTLNYFVCDEDRIRVGIHPDNYGRKFSLIHALHEKLTEAISFPFTVDSEPEIRILGGRSMKYILSVEMKIKPSIATEQAVAQLEENGFLRGFQESLG